MRGDARVAEGVGARGAREPLNDEELEGALAAAGEADPNEDDCSTCGQRGLLVFCSRCPKAFHVECLRLTVTPEEDDWVCPLCA